MNDHKLKEHRVKDFKNLKKELDIYTEEYKRFKETGNVSKQYLEKLLSNHKSLLDLEIGFCYE